MTPKRLQRLESLFDAAMEQAPAKRSAFLLQACPDDPELRAEAESLIRSHESAGDFIESPAVEEKFARELMDSGYLPMPRIGPYKIIRELARGGMGTVFLAVRDDDQYRMQVAIKLLKRNLNSESVVKRFKSERQILAGLDHPSIARLLDGGTTPDGIPYFVMEFIDGNPIDDYCRTRELSVTDRLQIFRAVCSAVHYAHRNLVIHRDLKPANILVTSEGLPKLLDFGIAKLLDAQNRADAVASMGLRLMTPRYASPEQLRGLPVTTSSDVYSLGVLLYELLTGEHPYRTSSQLPFEIAQAICEQHPEKPSSRVRANPETGKSAASAQSLRKRLSGDLDCIVMKALSKEPESRYASVEQLSEDIRRHLESRTVIARKDSLAYRTGKFIGRNRVAAIAAALIALALLGGIAVAGWQARMAQQQRIHAEAALDRAERRFQNLHSIASFLFEFDEQLKMFGGSYEARKALTQKGIDYLDNLSKESENRPALLKDLASGYIAVHRVNYELTDYSEAEKTIEKAVLILEALLNHQPENIEIRRMLLESYRSAANIKSRQGQSISATQIRDKAIAVADPLLVRAAEFGGDSNAWACLMALGNVNTSIDDQKEAVKSYQAALRILKTEGGKIHGFGHRSVAETYAAIAEAYSGIGDSAPGLLNARSALATLNELRSTYPESLLDPEADQLFLNRLGEIFLRCGEPGAAIERSSEAIAIGEELVRNNPDSSLRIRLAASRRNAARARAAAGKPEEAVNDLRQSIDLLRSVSSLDRFYPTARYELLSSLSDVADLWSEGGDLKQAEQVLREAVLISEELVASSTFPGRAEAELARLQLRLRTVAR